MPAVQVNLTLILNQTPSITSAADVMLGGMIADIVGQYSVANTAKVVTVKPALIMICDQVQVMHNLRRHIAWSMAACNMYWAYSKVQFAVCTKRSFCCCPEH